MYLEIVKVITRHCGLQDGEPGLYALQCCAAAGAEQEAQGLTWDPAQAIKAFAEVRQLSAVKTAAEIAVLCRKHNLPAPALVFRFFAMAAAKLEVDLEDFLYGAIDEPELDERYAQVVALAKAVRRAEDENGVFVTERG